MCSANDGTTLNYVHVDQCVIASRILFYNPFPVTVMNFPNFPYLTFDLRSKPSSTPIWNIMFKSICCRQQLQSVMWCYWVSTHNPCMPWLYAEGSLIVAWVRYENGTWRIRKMENTVDSMVFCASQCAEMETPLSHPPRQWLFLERAHLGPHALFMRWIHIHLSTSVPPQLNRCGTNIPRSKIQF